MDAKINRNKDNPLEEWEYSELNSQYQDTPSPNESFGASGQHYILWKMLHNYGYTLTSSKWDAYQLAEHLLSLRWVENGYYEKLSRVD